MELWHLWLVVPAYLFQTSLHEAAHAFFASMSGLRITAFYIWPHSVDDDPETPDYHFWNWRFWVSLFDAKKEIMFWGRVRWTGGPNMKPGAHWVGLIRFAPWIFSLPLWIVFWILIGFNAPLWLFVFFAATTLDLVRGSLQPLWRKERGDANKGAKAIDLDRVSLQFFGSMLSIFLIFGAGLLACFKLF